MVLQRTILWFGIFIIVMVTITKFMFICVWKSMRTINDDLMVRIAVNQAVLFKEYAEYIGHFLLEFFYYEVVTYDPT